MATQQIGITNRNKKAATEEILLRVFGIVVLLLGLVAMIILHARTALPASADISAIEKNAPQGASDAVQWLAWKLNLNRTQQQAVRPVVEKELQARAALLQTPEISTTEQEAQLVDLRNSMLEQIRPVLTEQQRLLVQQLEREGRS
jgi:hypothetical protein